jgi:uncharacterized protein YndB with AHSA1/START domain
MATGLQKAEVSLPSESEVLVTRQFNASRESVYRAYTAPSLVQRWLLGPPGWSMPVCEMDVRVGGRFRWRWRSDDDGKEFGFHGEFREVSPPSRLVHTQSYDPGDVGGDMGGDMGEGALITVEFTEKDGVTTMASRIDFGSGTARDAALATGMTDGMEASYRLLDELLGATVRDSA